MVIIDILALFQSYWGKNKSLIIKSDVCSRLFIVPYDRLRKVPFISDLLRDFVMNVGFSQILLIWWMLNFRYYTFFFIFRNSIWFSCPPFLFSLSSCFSVTLSILKIAIFKSLFYNSINYLISGFVHIVFFSSWL